VVGNLKPLAADLTGDVVQFPEGQQVSDLARAQTGRPRLGECAAQGIKDMARQLVDWKPGLAKGARVPTPSFGQGRRTLADQGSGITWGGVLRGHD
jgi:hypothetical protein